jgi:putative peptide maturation dehydrogenase
LKGEETALDDDELVALLATPGDRWADDFTIGQPELLHRLARKGLVLSDEADPELSALRRADELLASLGWNLWAALYVSLTRWDDVDVGFPVDMDPNQLAEGTAEIVTARLGPPPAPFHSLPNPRHVRELPLSDRAGPLYDLLVRRKTTRGFERGAPLTLDDLSAVLRYVYGCHGYAPFAERYVSLKKTSPSGGAMHPIEIYPLVRNVATIEPGLYHYNAEHHSLEAIERLEEVDVSTIATRLVSGQAYFGLAHVLFILVARVERNFWKYRAHDKSYATLLMDAAHLSQTLYLVATELGLGAFVTVAINNGYADKLLGLDGWSETTIAVSGCGNPASTNLEPEFVPFVPRETALDIPDRSR